MQQIENELIICDEEFIGFREKINHLNGMIEEKLTFLTNELQTVCEQGIMEGNVHENLTEFVAALQKMEGQLTYFSDEMASEVTEFENQIDILDCEFYMNGGE